MVALDHSEDDPMITVQELIQELEACDPNVEVFISVGRQSWNATGAEDEGEYVMLHADEYK